MLSGHADDEHPESERGRVRSARGREGGNEVRGRPNRRAYARDANRGDVNARVPKMNDDENERGPPKDAATRPHP